MAGTIVCGVSDSAEAREADAVLRIRAAPVRTAVGETVEHPLDLGAGRRPAERDDTAETAHQAALLRRPVSA